MPKYSFVFFYLLCYLNGYAQDFIFENISRKDGLSQNDVNCIIQDKQGFMWFGTNDGLNRYDGYQFSVYRYDAYRGGKGLNSNAIQVITEDRYHNIWVGLTNGGVNVKKHLNQQIINISVPNNEQNLLENENVYGIDFIDDIAIVLTKEAVFFFKFSEKEYVPIKIKDAFFIETGSKLTNCYHRISKNEFLIGTKHGLKHFRINNKKNFDVQIKNYEKKINVFRITPFRKGYLIAAKDQLLYLDQDFKFILLSKEMFNCILVEDDNKVWAGNDEGLHQLIFNSDASIKIEKRSNYTIQNTNGGFRSNFVSTIYKDTTGIIWVGTTGGGITKLIKRPNKFKLFHNSLINQNLKENRINCFLEDSKRNLWIGNENGQISYYKSGNYNYNKGGIKINNPEKSTSSILNFHELKIVDKSYIIVATGPPHSIQVYNLNAESVNKTPLFKALSKITHPINVMVSDDKYLWLGTREGGLYRYNYHSGIMNRFLKMDNQTLCSNLINTLCIDSKKNLWIGTDKGLNVLPLSVRDNVNPSYKIFKHNEVNSKSISFDNILTIIEDENKNIWIGTLGGGLNKYNYKTNSFTRLTVRNGLASNNIKGLLTDAKNQIWISSNNGISRLNLANNKIINFSVSDGLQDFEFRKRSCCMRDNGEMLFGGNNGFNSFFPELIKIDTTLPKLIFTRLNLVGASNNQDVFYNRAQLSKIIESSDAIRLKYNENSFTANFSALDYIAPTEIKYKYRLEGFENSWNIIGSESRFAKYTNLNPGHYTLMVLAANSDGVWLKKPLKLKIYIGKAWYNSNLAYVVYALLLFFVLVFFNRYSIIRNRIKHDLLMEHFEKEKMDQLSQLKLSFFTNISHEFRTPITVIKSYFENIAPNWKDFPEEKISQDFSVITRNINSLNRLVNQLLDFRKLEQDKMIIMPEKGDIIPLITSCITSFNIIAVTKNIELSFQHNIEKLEFWFDEDKMEKIINNIISNALKYSNEAGKVIIRVEELDDEIKIEIEDTGIGIPQNIQSSIFERFYQANSLKNSVASTGIGLNLTKGLIDLHHGRIELFSSEGNGSNFILFFKKGNSHFNISEVQHIKPNGSLVVIENTEDQFVEISNQMEFTGKSILIVEDNDDLRSFLSEKLKNFFYVDVAENGKLALKKCLENTPDIVLSDIMMPEMDGYELCDTIKNNEAISHIPVVLLTAKTSIESELQGFKLGADAYVGKPFNLDVLIARIDSILKSREKVWKKITENPFFSPSEVTFTVKDEQFLHKITAIIEKYMVNSEFSVEQLAELYGTSKMNLNNKIKALTGKTSVQFIRLIRLRKAAQLLQAKHSRISDVTYDVGYSDLQHFREHFKKEFLVSPNEYKKMHSPD